MKYLIITICLTFFSYSFLNAQDKENSGVTFKLGYSIVQHLESDIYGQSTTFLNPAGDSNSDLIGLRSMNGLDLKGYYFFQNNLGLYFNLGFGLSDNFIDFQNPNEPYYSFETKSDYHNESIGIAARLTSDRLPVNFIMGLHVGHFGYSYSYTIMVDDNGLWYHGSYSALKTGLEASMNISIYKGFHIFSELSYSIRPLVSGTGFELDYEDDAGNFYRLTFNSPSMASLKFSLGLGYNF